MPAQPVTLDADGAPRAPALRTCLRLLAQRGARLTTLPGGGAVEAQRHGEPVVVAWIDDADVASLVGAGWLAAVDGNRFTLSPAGRAIVRLMKAAPSPAEAGAGSTPAPPPAPPITVAAADRGQSDPASPLAWLRARRNADGAPLLSDQAFEAGERLREDFHFAGLMPRLTVDLTAVPRTADERRGMAATTRDRGGGEAARERVRQALAAVPPELAGLLLDVCCYGHRLQAAEKTNGIPQRAAHYLLCIALNGLARHYGLLPPADGSWMPRRSRRHWGTPDYRPTIDGEAPVASD